MSGDGILPTTNKLEHDHHAVDWLMEQKSDDEMVRVNALYNFDSFASGALVVLVIGQLELLENSVDSFSTSIVLLMLAALNTMLVVWLANHVLKTTQVVGQLAFEAILYVLKLLQGYFFLLFFILINGNLLSSIDPFGIIPLVSFFTLWFFFSRFLTKLTTTKFSDRKRSFRVKG